MRVRLPLAALALVLSTGCWQTARKSPPTLTEQALEVEETVERLARIEAAMDEELAGLRDLVGRFFSLPNDTWRAPFPVDLFKHTAMSCLNAPYDESPPDPSVQEVAEQFRITCAVAPLVVLREALGHEGVPRGEVLDNLRLVDELRSGRASLQSRMRQLPGILRRTHAFIEVRRSEARRTRQDLEARKAEYSRDALRASRAELDQYEVMLDSLLMQLVVLEEKGSTWSRELVVLVEQLYKGISYLPPT